MKKILAIALVFVIGLTMVGCNKQIVDTTYRYDRAIVSLPDGTIIDGKIDSWRDYEDGDQIQVKINGTTYLVHSEDIALIS